MDIHIILSGVLIFVMVLGIIILSIADFHIIKITNSICVEEKKIKKQQSKN